MHLSGTGGAGKSDRDMVGAVLGGDREAFAELYRSHLRAVVRVVRDNVHDADTVADVTQEVFVRALDRLPSLRDPTGSGPGCTRSRSR